MQRLNVLRVLIPRLISVERDNLWNLAFLLFYLSLAHSDLHVGFSKRLHGRGGGSVAVAHVGGLVLVVVFVVLST